MLQLLTEATVDEKVTHLGLGAIPLNLCLCTTHTVMGSGATSDSSLFHWALDVAVFFEVTNLLRLKQICQISFQWLSWLWKGCKFYKPWMLLTAFTADIAIWSWPHFSGGSCIAIFELLWCIVSLVYCVWVCIIFGVVVLLSKVVLEMQWRQQSVSVVTSASRNWLSGKFHAVVNQLNS